MKKLIPLFLATLLTPAMVYSQVIVNDSWSSGTRTSPPNDAGWWYSTSSSAIEVGTGYLGLVSGGSGRGIAGTFTSQSLGIGDTLTATFTFTTPATVGSGKSAAFRVGFMDTTGHTLAQDITASSGSPNALYNNLNGYMMTYDVNLASGNNIDFMVRSNPNSGQLLATTGDYTDLAGGGGGSEYSFLANTTYTGVYSVTLTGANTLNLTGSLFEGSTELSTYTLTGIDSSGSTSTFGMLAFQVGSSTFGSSSAVGAPDNGIDFTNIKIELTPAPEPSTMALGALGLVSLGIWCRRARKTA